MKQRISISLTLFIAIIAVLTVTVSCNKKFDAPPFQNAENLTPNTTIAALKAVHTVLASVNPITDSSIIEGTVVANDQSGNIYKALYIADATGGIQLMMGGSNLYSSYPVGMHLFIKCKGLGLSDYNGDMELGLITNISGSAALTAIPTALFATYVVPGTTGNPVPVKIVTLAQLKSAAATAAKNPSLDTLQNTLVQINNAQFSDTTGLIYSDTSSAKGNISRTVTDCPGGTTVIYTSGYSNFAGVTLPKGGGTISAVYVPYKTTSELLIRDTSDVQFTGLRCNGGTGSGGGGTTPPPALASGLVSLQALRAAYAAPGIKVNTSQQITGVVISDATSKNLSAGEVIIQQGNYGMAVYFGGTITYSIGDSLVIDISGDSLISYFGSLEVKFAPGGKLTKPTATATGITIVPQVKTVAQLNASLVLPLNNAGNNENTLVQIASATITGASGPYYTKGVYPNLTDNGTDKIELFTTSAATFGSTTMPTTAKQWTGYGNSYKGFPEFMIRNLNDVQ